MLLVLVFLSKLSKSVVTTVQKTSCDSTPRVTSVSILLSIAAKTASLKKSIDKDMSVYYESKIVKKLSDITEHIDKYTDELEEEIAEISSLENVIEESAAIRDKMLSSMDKLRNACDEAEILTAKEYWPFPTYGELLFSVR